MEEEVSLVLYPKVAKLYDILNIPRNVFQDPEEFILKVLQLLHFHP
jgi:hypothetical protein